MEGELREKRQELSSELPADGRCAPSSIQAPPRRIDRLATASLGVDCVRLADADRDARLGNKPAASLSPAQNSMDIVGRVGSGGLATQHDRRFRLMRTAALVGRSRPAATHTAVRVLRLIGAAKSSTRFRPVAGAEGSAGSSQPRSQVVNALPRGVQLGSTTHWSSETTSMARTRH
jgi:hypothetical protein